LQERYLFDGFPRTIPQAEALRDSGVDLDFVLEIDVDHEEIIRRLSGRRVHPASGRNYISPSIPEVSGKDDLTVSPSSSARTTRRKR